MKFSCMKKTFLLPSNRILKGSTRLSSPAEAPLAIAFVFSYPRTRTQILKQCLPKTLTAVVGEMFSPTAHFRVFF